MADDEKKAPARKSRREVMYDAASRGKKPEPAPEPKAEEPAADNGGASEAAAVSSPIGADMFRRHEADRRTMHGNHRSEHRAIEKDGGDDMMQKKLAAHRRHRNEMDSLHEKHEQELLEQLAAMQKREAAPGGEQEAA